MIFKLNLKKSIILIIFILPTILAFCYYYKQSRPNFDIELELNTRQTRSLLEDNINVAFNNQKAELDSRDNPIENWDLYEPILSAEEKWVGTGDCGLAEFNNFLLKANQGEMSLLKLQGTLDLLITPNYYYWSNEQFLNFLYQSNAICAVAGRYPLRAYEDKLLWIGTCYEEELDCKIAQYLVERFKEKYK